MAAGFEKIRNEHTILVWDVRGNNTPTLQPLSNVKFTNNNTNTSAAGTESMIYCVNLTNYPTDMSPPPPPPTPPPPPPTPSSGMPTSRHASLFAVPTGLMSSLNTGVATPIFHTSSSNGIASEASRSGYKQDLIRSIYETGTSETCNSLAWHPHNQYSLLAGVNGKTLKVFDIRG